MADASFKHMVIILDGLKWPPASDFKWLGNQEIIEMMTYFKNLFSTGPTEVEKILVEWSVLKPYMLRIISNNKMSTYLNTWKITFTNSTITTECKSVLDIFDDMSINKC